MGKEPDLKKWRNNNADPQYLIWFVTNDIKNYFNKLFPRIGVLLNLFVFVSIGFDLLVLASLFMLKYR